MTNYDKIAYDFFQNSYFMNDYFKRTNFKKEKMKLELFSQNDKRMFYVITIDGEIVLFSGMIVIEKETGEVFNPYINQDKEHSKNFLALEEEMFDAKYEEEKAKELLDYGRW